MNAEPGHSGSLSARPARSRVYLISIVGWLRFSQRSDLGVVHLTSRGSQVSLFATQFDVYSVNRETELQSSGGRMQPNHHTRVRS